MRKLCIEWEMHVFRYSLMLKKMKKNDFFAQKIKNGAQCSKKKSPFFHFFEFFGKIFFGSNVRHLKRFLGLTKEQIRWLRIWGNFWEKKCVTPWVAPKARS